jgi:hypothetical protein
MRRTAWSTSLVCLLAALPGATWSGVVFDNSPIRTVPPNGAVVQSPVSAADDFMLDAEAVLTGGQLWTWEQVGLAAPTAVNYAFWLDDDASSLLPTKPSEKPVPDGSGVATLRQRNVAGANQVIGSIEYASYEYLFELEQALGLPAGVPLWFSVSISDAWSGTDARYLWALSASPDDSLGAWLTADVAVTTGVDWVYRAPVGTAFVLYGDERNEPGNLPVPSALVLMLTALAFLAVRQRGCVPEPAAAGSE